jgi:hypothetical protein
MPNIRSIDMLFLDDLFEMRGGYVLNFSDRTYAEFFQEELGINIDEPKYSLGGTSKGKRLRYFLQNIDKPTVVRTLNALWDYREAIRMRAKEDEKVPDAKARIQDLVRRLGGQTATGGPTTQAQSKPVADPARLTQLSLDLIELSKLAPQPRGYAFETFLKELFDAHGMEGRAPFRLTGEQIDGSFLLMNETYLLEAKWQNAPIGVGDLHAFHGKVEGKTAWTRGLFISQTGFSDDGIVAFGRGKRVICMDGFDLYEVLRRGLPLEDVLAHKVRRANETGAPFIRVRDLFPE